MKNRENSMVVDTTSDLFGFDIAIIIAAGCREKRLSCLLNR